MLGFLFHIAEQLIILCLFRVAMKMGLALIDHIIWLINCYNFYLFVIIFIGWLKLSLFLISFTIIIRLLWVVFH